MSQLGEVFHERRYESSELRTPEFTDINGFVSLWQELIDSRQSTADSALSELVDSLDPDEYTAAVRAFITELELYDLPFELLGEGFVMPGAQGDTGMFSGGVFYKRMSNDRRTIHRILATMHYELEHDLNQRGLDASLDCFECDDYDYARPTIRILSAWHADQVEVEEKSLEAKVHEIVADSNMWIFGQEPFMTDSADDPIYKCWINGEAAADLIDYVAEKLPDEARLVFARTIDDFFERLTGREDKDGRTVYSPFFDHHTYGQSWEADATEDSPGGISQVVGTWEGMLQRIREELTEREDWLNEDEWTGERLLLFLGLYDEQGSLYNGVDPDYLLAVRGQPQLFSSDET
jgi:hypothetical protein